MRNVKVLLAVLVLGAIPISAAAQKPESALDQAVDKIVAQEHGEIQMLRQYSPLVETYIQKLRADKELGTVPDGDQYFLGRAELAKGVDIEPLSTAQDQDGVAHKMLSSVGGFFSLSMQFVPQGFLQMIYVDTDGFDRQHYHFDYVRREFLGEVRCLVFDVTPLPKAGKGRFIGRIWVEDQDFHIVRFNGAYTGGSKTHYYFHFDSWRVNAGKNLWLPAFIYSEEGDLHYGLSQRLRFKAQTRLWGYDLGHVRQEEELSKILVEAQTPVKDQTETAHDISPIQAQRSWDRQAEDNVIDRMERMGLLAPPGDVDKVLETVVNNLEVTNDLNLQPEVRCRVLMTSTLESFTLGHTIVLSRGLIDVLPDEATLAAMLAHELGHIVLGHRIDTQYAFFDRLLFNEKEVFQHFTFGRTPEEEKAADVEAAKLLAKSPYKNQLATAQRFLQALQERQKEIPNLISPHLGDPISADMVTTNSAAPVQAAAKPNGNVLVALPLGGRIKVDPWNDELHMLKSKPVGTVAERERMPFEVTPFVLYLTRVNTDTSLNPSGAVSADSKTDASTMPSKPE
jgi:Peptidase family M48